MIVFLKSPLVKALFNNIKQYVCQRGVIMLKKYKCGTCFKLQKPAQRTGFCIDVCLS